GGVERYRQHERPGEENRLSGERAPERAPARSRELVAPDAAGGELDEIEDPPLQREHAVQQPDVEVLAAMMRAPWLPGREAKPRTARFDVFIEAGVVGVGVMQQVVLLPPEMRARTQQIERAGHDAVQA